MNNLSMDQLKLLINLFSSNYARETFIKNTGILNEINSLNKFNEEFSADICSKIDCWTDEKISDFEKFITDISVKKFLWPIILRSVTCGMAEGDERVSVTGSHLL